MFIVTGGAGFIGSNLIKALNDRGIDDILLVDHLKNADKVINLSDLRIADYIDKATFRHMMKDNWEGNIDVIFHQGACSDTMETDGRYVMENNFTYSKLLYHFCQRHHGRLIYASSAAVYGASTHFAEDPANELPLNAYAYSKLLFDNYLRRQRTGTGMAQIAGLRYFNVYGPREQHKGRMASVGWHFHQQYQASGSVRLFKGSGGYGDGEQRRDFVSVDDVVRVNLFLWDHPDISGIFNVGTGRGQSFNEVALAVINACRASRQQTPVGLHEAIESGEIQYVPIPDVLVGKYQSYTCADLSRLRESGYVHVFETVEQGIGKYVKRLSDAS